MKKDEFYFEACDTAKEMFFRNGSKQTDEQVEEYAERLRQISAEHKDTRPPAAYRYE